MLKVRMYSYLFNQTTNQNVSEAVHVKILILDRLLRLFLHAPLINSHTALVDRIQLVLQPNILHKRRVPVRLERIHFRLAAAASAGAYGWVLWSRESIGIIMRCHTHGIL